MHEGEATRRSFLAPAFVGLAHTATVAWLFGTAFTDGRLLYFRDLSTYYAPAYAFAEQSLRAGVWPLWNPFVNGGEPFLLAYPVDLALLRLGGWHWCLGVGPALHLLLAMTGASRLARTIGAGYRAAWLAGAVYGLGGLMASLVNLVQLFQAAAWAPWVLAGCVITARRPTAVRVALLALATAMQVSTLGLEIVALTAVAAVVLCADRLLRRSSLTAVAAAALLAGLLAAPALLGLHALLQGTARQQGFPLGDALAYSIHPLTLPGMVLPRWLGDAQRFTDASFWARVFFPSGFPYLLTLYVGLPTLLLAANARCWRRLWLLAAAALLVALGAYAPLGLLPEWLRLPARGPQKAFFLVHLSLALLAGFGLERREREPGTHGRWALVPALLLVVAAAILTWAPAGPLAVLGMIAAPLREARAIEAARTLWPAAWLVSGALAMGVAVVLAGVRGGRFATLAGVAAVVDLLVVNGGVNQLAPPSFYALRPEVASLLEPVRRAGGRLFTFGVAVTPGLALDPRLRDASDVWLYYLDRQSVLHQTYVLDGIEGGFDSDRTGWSPEGATLEPSNSTPDRLPQQVPRLLRGGVRWVLSFRDPPPELAILRGRVRLPEIGSPLGLFELAGALPRAYYVAGFEVLGDPRARLRRLADPEFDPSRVVLLGAAPVVGKHAAPSFIGHPQVAYERIDAHTVRVTARTPPGLLVVLDGFHRDWVAEAKGTPVPLLHANDRYRALVTPGGDRVFTMRFRPVWLVPALTASAVGVAVVLGLLVIGCVRFHRTASIRAC